MAKIATQQKTDIRKRLQVPEGLERVGFYHPKLPASEKYDKLGNSEVFSCQNKLSQAMRKSRVRMAGQKMQ